jgi:hypothetical protein
MPARREDNAMRLTTTFAICAFAAAAIIGPALAPALAASSDYFLKLGPIKGEGSAARQGHQEQIEILSYSFGATRKGWDGTVKGGSSAADDAAARKGWDGTVKGGNVAENSAAAKFGAIAGAHRDDSIAKPAARIAAPPARGSVTVAGSFPGCIVGTRYVDAVLQVPGARYVMQDVQIAMCSAPRAARSSMAGEYLRGGISLNYKKVTVRGWDPAKKEE